ncbi:alpha/beta fold hydrolase [Microlunatus parietis]|uniref:Pimeloyl-ACP methyl ester carboxylesterase n=1 Tax=Microlunatus parietis TaxID=682979 RepID=A0A7Y9LB07_9ACTN|nr:alpha/beta hydrolase [Microlunatus parietis]NYE73379.1 pimeloyl-ACP methyl ester carboxylesterase [Microlunatus parietis]
MESTKSADGTIIAYDRDGAGDPIVFISGAFNDRTKCAPVAELLRDTHTVICYDRRGRGDSTDEGTVAGIPADGPDRELADLSAVLEAAGGSAAVLGFSSGGVLALQAAAAGLPITKIALYEPPLGVDRAPDLPERLAELIIAGRRGDAVATFQREGIGLPPAVVEQIRQSPGWPYLEAMATSVGYDAAVTRLGLPDSLPDLPMIVLNGAETWPGLRELAAGLAAQVPGMRHLEVPGGENHTMPPAATAEALRTFLAGAES